MELTLQPLAKTCRASGRAFEENDRVICRLVREQSGEITRYDVLAAEDANSPKPEYVFCTWTVAFKARRADENPGRALKLTAENLFVTLADPAAEPDESNIPLLQFLALLLERKKVLRPRGQSSDGLRQILEHARTHQRYEVPVGILDEAFFVKIQGQLDLLVGGPKKQAADGGNAAPIPAMPANAASEAPSPGVAANEPAAGNADPVAGH